MKVIKYSILFIIISICSADRGMIPVNPYVQIFEPTQRAMIAWNGSEEILLLSTDISASESTIVLEVLPLRSEPVVKKGDIETFRRAIELINSKIQMPLEMGKRNGDSKGPQLPGGEVTFHEQIGAHDISVTHLLDPASFIEWVKEYLASIEIEADVISEDMNELINGYIGDDFQWFVFDVVTVGTETVTNEPIQYRFPTNKLFYPLKITSTASGETSVELLILTPRLLKNFPDLPITSVSLPHDPITITNDELKMLDEDMHGLLKKYDQLKLRIWNISGALESFDADLIAY
jgi:hypothetical protein